MNLAERLAVGGTAELWSLADAPDRVVKLARGRRRDAAALDAEAVALAALRTTGVAPHGARVTLAGRPALVLERLDGPTLAAWRPPSVQVGLALAAALAEQVAVLHDAGWIHGDLSADNVVIVDASRAPRPRLIDFGAATPIGRPAPALATRAYLAPERLGSTRATPALDVYALGALAHLLIVGQAPFAGCGRAAALAQRDHQLPSLAAWLDARGDAAIRAALAKRPELRPDARALAHELARATAAVAAAATRAPTTAKRPRLARGTRPATRHDDGPLLGRDRELAIVRAAVAGRGDASLLTIVGDAGLGKSALLATARRAAPHAAFLDGARPLAALVAALPALGSDDDRAALLHAIGDGPAPASAIAPGALRAAAARAIAAGLRSMTTVIVDDGHAADPLLLDAIERLTADATWAGGAVVAARPSLLQTRPRWGARARAANTLELGPLDPTAASALVRRRLPELLAIPERAVADLVTRSGGRPLVLLELIAHLRATGRVVTGADGVASLRTDQLDLPDDGAVLDRTVAAELDRLPPALTAMAQAIAVVGELPVERLGAVLDDPTLGLPLDGRVAVARLVRAGLLVADDAPRFRHDLVRAAVAATVDPSHARALHAAVLAHGGPLALAARAHHLAGAGGDALAAWRALAEDALARHDYLIAERAASSALAAAGDDVTLLRIRGRARARLGHHATALDDLDRAAHGAVGPDRAALLLEAATALDWLTRYRDAAALTAAASEAAGPTPPPAVVATLTMARGRDAWRRGELADARALLLDALAQGESPALADRYELELATRLMLGWLLPGLGAPDEAAAQLDRASALAAAHGDELHLAAVENNRYALHAARGDEAAARAALARFTARARGLGLDIAEYRGRQAQAVVAWWCGDHVAAEGHVAVSLTFERAAPARFRRPRAALLAAALALVRGERRAAVTHAAHARAALAGATEHGADGDRLNLTALELALDDRLDDAAVDALAARALVDGDAELGFELLLLAARLAAAGGRRAAAAALDRRARAISPSLPALITQHRCRQEDRLA